MVILKKNVHVLMIVTKCWLKYENHVLSNFIMADRLLVFYVSNFN